MLASTDTTSLSSEILDEAFSDFRSHAAQLANRSDRRALWMACVAVALCRQNPARLEGARRCLEKWTAEQPWSRTLFATWRRLLRSCETLTEVLDPTEENQELRSASPLVGCLMPGEHPVALRFFQELYPGMS
jgi:hypothetical protein